MASRSAQQEKKDLINVTRLLRSLEEISKNGDGEADRDYYKTLSTLSGIKHARSLVDRAKDCSASQRTNLLDRLDRLQEHYKSLHQSTQPPKRTRIIEKSDLEALRPKAVPVVLPEEAVILDPASNGAVDTDAVMSKATVADDLLPLKSEDALTGERHRRRSSMSATNPVIAPSSTLSPPASENGNAPLRTPSPSSTTHNTTQSMSTLLSHHRSEQESLTEELALMASRLKANSMQFSDLLANDKALMEEAEQKLEGNLSGMTKERERLKGYSKKGGVTTWFVVGAVVAVMCAWMFMFALMRVL